MHQTRTLMLVAASLTRDRHRVNGGWPVCPAWSVKRTLKGDDRYKSMDVLTRPEVETYMGVWAIAHTSPHFLFLLILVVSHEFV